MTETSPTLVDMVDERLAMLWYQVDRIGDHGLRREIEDVADRFMFPGDTPIGDEDIEGAHELFQSGSTPNTPPTYRPGWGSGSSGAPTAGERRYNKHEMKTLKTQAASPAQQHRGAGHLPRRPLPDGGPGRLR